ncbi:MAG: ectonucleotide pyrophosphatase/phosphodiesterase [Ferruginibacter sp.]
MKMLFKLKSIFLIATILLVLLFSNISLMAQDTLEQKVPGRKNLPQQINQPYVILISADGYRFDYTDRFNAVHLKKLRKKGVQAKSMIPSYPSVTFPNHYTIATGLYPSHHGLVYNQFYDRSKNDSYSMSNRKAVEDPSWYGGTPLWVLAEQQGMVSATNMFVGSEAPIQGKLLTYWYRYTEKIPIADRIQKVVNWLQLPDTVRPHLISFYMSEVDHEGHDYGPDAPQTRDAVYFVDNVMQQLTEKVDALGLQVNYIFVSDHGMSLVDTLTRINVNDMVDTSQFIIRGGGTSLHLYAKDTRFIDATYEQLKAKENGFTVFKKSDIPKAWRYDASNDFFNRIGDLLVVPTYPKVLSWRGRIKPGAHGFDPAIKEMHAVFYAWGSGIKKGKKTNSFENVHVYPFVAALLGLQLPNTIDGDVRVLKKFLRK